MKALVTYSMDHIASSDLAVVPKDVVTKLGWFLGADGIAVYTLLCCCDSRAEYPDISTISKTLKLAPARVKNAIERLIKSECIDPSEALIVYQ
jgi:hypothetical protein